MVPKRWSSGKRRTLDAPAFDVSNLKTSVSLAYTCATSLKSTRRITAVLIHLRTMSLRHIIPSFRHGVSLGSAD